MGVKDVVKFFGKKPSKAKDPVCGMQVNLGSARSKSEYQGKIYGFCSAQCKATFDQNPFQFADVSR